MNKKKLLIIMSNSDAKNPEDCYAPLFQATIAAALSHEVEVVFTGVSVQLGYFREPESGAVEIALHIVVRERLDFPALFSHIRRMLGPDV